MKKQLLSLASAFSITIALMHTHTQAQTLWGMANGGGIGGYGTIFSYATAGQTETTDYSFGGSNSGESPQGYLMLASNGLFYGFNGGGYGGFGYGTLFNYNIATNTYNVLHDFGQRTSDGIYPMGAPIQVNGLLYGTTSSGGPDSIDQGTIFTYSFATDSESVIYSFNFASTGDGEEPAGTLLQVGSNMLYGLTNAGGINDDGAIFSYDVSTNKEAVVYAFGTNNNDGEFPVGSLIQDTNNLLYGMTENGGVNDEGTIFSYNITTGKETLLYNFGSVNDGSEPLGSLIQAKNGLLYGMTSEGGTHSNGIIFSYNVATDVETDLYNFVGDDSDGSAPQGALLQVSNGLLYGTTEYGGNDGEGIIFSYDIATATEIVLYEFQDNLSDGNNPTGNLIEDDATGLNQLTVDNGQLTVYPNPTSDFIHTTIQLNQPSNLQLRLVNMMGQTVRVTDAETVNSYQNNISVANLPDGVYLLEMVTGSGMESKEIIVTH